jgi:hypothetical protein
VLRIYSLGSPYGAKFCEEFAKGNGGIHDPKPFAAYSGDPIAVWGQLRGAKELLKQSKTFYRIDHAYLGRKDYYRFTKDDFQPKAIVERPGDRWEKLKKQYSPKMGPWRKGKNVVVALSRPDTYRFFGVEGWPERIEQEIRKYTDRPIVMRDREAPGTIGAELSKAHCVVTYASNSVIDALLAGVPVFTLGPSIARPMGHTDVSLIESPLYPENREEFFRHMAYCQFTPSEFKDGTALRITG